MGRLAAADEPGIDSERGLPDVESNDRHDKTPRRVPDRMAGRAFALAADPSLLAAHARHRGRLRHRGGAAGRFRGFRRCGFRMHGFVGANVTIPHKEQRAGAVEAGRARQGGRRRQYAVVRGRRTALDQHRRRRLYQQSRRLRARLGQRHRCAGARRRRLVARGGVRPDRARHQARASGQPHHRTRAGAGGSIRRRACIPSRGTRSANCCRAPGCW